MQTIHAQGTTGADGTLNLSIPLGSPQTQFDVVVVAQAKVEKGTTSSGAADPWKAIDEFRQRLAASGRVFSDSVDDIREDRDR